VSDEGIFGVKIWPTACESWCKGFADDCLKIRCKVSINKTEVAEIGEFSVVSAV
jgi:hypothetical protein